jgi:hypothetical protein
MPVDMPVLLADRRRPPRRWPWFVLAGAIASLLGLGWFARPGPAPPAAAGDGTDAPDGWSRFQAPDGSFAVVGPSSPSLTAVPSQIGSEHEVRFDAPEGQVLGLEWVDVSPGLVAGGSEADLLAAWANNVVADLGGVLDEQDVLRAGTHPGVGLRLESGGRWVYVRVFTSGMRLYEVASVVPSSAASADRTAGERFVDSFELLT